ncbi:NERD domain-containing protein [Vibrio crassostreae]|uniref:hypothetical protein n=1 Tax=Vibrio crassostreae TaxID=246167 RepID=UPI001B30F006|nr:hypothetical protein [Vibrio crassostreae]CAK1744509.1 NERD domain-containing protein [Vibrio crassostreae]CAK1762936.1 NERD domain-containing protein [Vibrio crassostreae]CAK1763146.1 NERD domain-containing protein [Vibrio crassostreae]CAK1763182.1 NERD domain-containing protein [Vibrio crassostreae]CAK1764550.1 NERD domain-containing protein [Vibrio crassostreae]
MLKELNKFNLKKFSEYLASGSADDDSIIKIIDSTLTRPDIVQIRNNKVRKQRDDFIDNLLSLTSSYSDEVKRLIISKVKIIKVSEELFDKISKFIKQCDISNEPKEIQVWSHIKRVESEFELIHKDLGSYLSKPGKPKNKVLSPYTIIENDKGSSFSVDAASEHLIQYLSITLQLLSHEFKMFNSGKVVIPNQGSVSDTNVFQAGSMELLARSWRELEDSCQRSILFGGDVFRCREDEVQKDARENGVKLSYHYERNESDYEMFDAISCERVKKRSLQHYLDILSNPELRKKVTSNIDTVGNLIEQSYLSENEILTCIVLGDIFCVNVLEDQKDYNGLTLAEWIRSYSTFQRISQDVEIGENNNIFSHEYIVELLESVGIPKEKGEIFIDLITFSQGSKDLFDCPLIKMENGGYYFAYYSCSNFSAANVILSRFSSLEAESSDKGFKFESDVIEMVREGVGNCEGFKFKRGLDEYEYDAVFTIDNKLFILECKNRSLSWYNPVKAFRNKKYLYETTEQVLRLKDALISHPEVLQEKLGIDVAEYEIIPVIFNCMPFCWKGTCNNVYVTDYSSFSRLLRSSEINLVMSSNLGQKPQKTSKYKQWIGSKVCGEDIINHLNNPIQIVPYIKSRKRSDHWWVGDNETAFTVMNFEVDVPKYERQEKKFFTSTPSETKRGTKSNRKSMIKSSKKKNRRK